MLSATMHPVTDARATNEPDVVLSSATDMSARGRRLVGIGSQIRASE